ncbi:hypothetical protein [Bdellovibrio sp. HCB337]|uniref:hypothetical protein n=1 Tax=Bdellovibrio sp. HCB337 TaxID=3394358 RepID=UPI0039A6DCDD
MADKMKGFSTNVQDGVKNSSVSLVCLTLRVLTGFMLGLTLGLIGQELVGYGSLALTFMLVVVMGLVIKTTSGWNLGKILIFDLFLVLLAMLLRMYILVAP